MSDNLEERLDRLAAQAGSADPGPPAALIAAIRQRRAQRSLQRVFIVGAATLVSAAACITLVVVFGGRAGAPPNPPRAENRAPHAAPAQPGVASVYTVAHGWTAADDPEAAPAPAAEPGHGPSRPERIFSVGSIYSRDVAEGLLS